MRFGDVDTENRPKLSIEWPSRIVTGTEPPISLSKLSYQLTLDRDCLVRSRGVKRSRTPDLGNYQQSELPPTKKRRLRLDLVTSMLSRPYALPPRHIPARRAARTGPWARQRIARRDLLRKAAIFNKIALRRRISGMRGIDHRKLTRQAALLEYVPSSMVQCYTKTNEADHVRHHYSVH